MDAETEPLCVIDVDSSADPRGEMVQALLRARFAYKRAQTVRAQWFQLVFFLFACVLAAGAIGVTVIGEHWAATLLVSGVLIARALAAAAVEWGHYHRWLRLMEDYRGVRITET